MSMRKVLLLALIAAFAAGCGGSGKSSSSGGSTTLAAEPSSERAGQTLTIYGFGPGDDIANNRAAIATKALAPAKVKNPAGAYNPQAFLTRLASGSPPDLIYVDRQQIATLAAKQALERLNGCVKGQSINLSQYRQAALDEATYQGQLYALPEFTNQRTLIVNLDAVRQAGLNPSDVSTTGWNKLKTVTRKLTVMNGGKLQRIGFDPKVPEFFILWAHANGAQLLSLDGKTAHLNDPKAVDALAYTKWLIDEQGGWSKFKSFRDTWDFFGKDNQVAKDQVGAWPMESWYWNVMAQNSPNVNVAAVPFTDKQGRPFTFFTGSGWAIPKGAQHPALACTWMKTMTSTPTWMTAATKRAASAKASGYPFTGLYTANAVADRQILNQVYKPNSPEYDKAVKLLVQVQDNAVFWPASPAGTQVQQALTDAINRVLAGSQTPKQALDRAQTEAQNAIDSTT